MDQAGIWKQILERLDRSNHLLEGLQPAISLDKGKIPIFDVGSIDQQIIALPDTFSGRLQRFKEGHGFSISETSSVSGGSSTPAATQYKKLLIRNPENSPVVVIAAVLHVSISAINFLVLEGPAKPASTSAGTPYKASPNKVAGRATSNAEIQYITSATAPSRPFMKVEELAANSPRDIDLGIVLPPNSEHISSLNFAAGTEAWALGIEWFEIPLI